jgi:phosphohistidine phosphatase SixA
VTAGWLRNTDLARKTVQTIADMGHAPIAEMLVEDGCFEERIPLPVAIMAELFWNAEDEDNNATMEKVAKYSFVSI